MIQRVRSCIQISLSRPTLRSTTYSAAKVLLCMRRRSTSRVLLTRKALWPEGIMWRVFLFDPKPICKLSALVQHFVAQRSAVIRRSRIVVQSEATPNPAVDPTYRWHNHLTLESSSDTVVNTLGLSPASVDTFVGVALVSSKLLGSWIPPC